MSLFILFTILYNPFMDNCIFCKIVKKEIDKNILFETENVLVFEPLNPISNGHVLIIPKIHFENIFDIDEKVLSDIIINVKKISENIVKEKGATGINILHASGKDAQQSVFHFHIHIVPRYPDDGLDLWIRNKL